MSKVILWEDKQRQSAQDLISWLLAQRGESGWPASRINLVAFRELISMSLDSKIEEGAIMKTLGVMATENKSSVYDFEQIHHSLNFPLSPQQGISDQIWTFFLPLQVGLGADVKLPYHLRILGQKFSIVRKGLLLRQFEPSARKEFSNPKVVYLETGCDYQQLPNTFLKVCATAPTWEEAWRISIPAFDTLRGLIEITFNLFTFKSQFIRWGRRKPRSYLPHPKWMVGHRKGDPLVWIPFLVDEHSSEETTNKDSLSAEVLHKIKFNCRHFKNPVDRGNIISLVADCMRLYAQALDSRTNALTLLGLWQLAEAITNSEKHGGKTDVVVNRLAWHSIRSTLKGSGYRATLVKLGKKRNDIVHRGISDDIDDEDIDILKLACEHALLWLISFKSDLPTINHLEKYYLLRETNNVDLKALSDVVRIIRQERSQLN